MDVSYVVAHGGEAEDAEYAERLNRALREKIDVWGEQLIARPEGPTYENMVGLLRPMMFCGDYATETGVYYLVFGKPAGLTGGGDRALHVADGSEIITRRYKRGRKTFFFVGEDGNELFGSNIDRLAEPRLFKGYQPVLIVEYTDEGGVVYEHQSFATYIEETGSLVSFVRLVVKRAPRGIKQVTFRVRCGAKGLRVEENRVVKDGKTYLCFEPGAQFAPPFLTWKIDLSRGGKRAVHLVRLNRASECANFVPNEKRFLEERKKLCQYWDNVLAEGAKFQVPEPLVMNAMRNLLIQNIFMCWRYSIGNAYETWYPHESLEPVKVLGEYGYIRRYRANLEALLKRSFSGGKWQLYEWGEKLLYSAHYFFLTRDRTFIEANRKKLTKFMQAFLDAMASDPKGILPPMQYSGDIATPGYTLHHQAICWRGMRDMALIYELLGYEAEARKFAQGAKTLRTRLLEAVDASKVELPDDSLFIPVLLFRRTKPYDPITKTRMGSYWNLVSPYVFASGIIPPRSRTMRRVIKYVLNHGGRFLGLTRFNYYPVPIGSRRANGLPGYRTTGADNVYAPRLMEVLAEQDEADQIGLSFYGKLAHGMTRGTFIAGEGDCFEPSQKYRSLYLPPNSANNALFLKILHDMLVFSHVDESGRPSELLLAHFTPCGWLADGKEIRVTRAPTPFGEVSFRIKSRLKQKLIEAEVKVPSTNPPEKLVLRLRTPSRAKMAKVVLNGKSFNRFNPAQETIDLSGLKGRLRLRVYYR